MINQSIPTPFSIEDEFRRLSHLPELQGNCINPKR